MNSSIKTARNDMRTLMNDAQELFREAAHTTGDKAEELRSKGLLLLDTAMERAQELQTVAVAKGKVVAHDTNEFVQENPWKAVGIAAGIGFVIGMLVGRR